MTIYKPNTQKKYGIIIIGAGGTGSWLSSYLSKLQDRLHSVTLVDGDVVEPKNLSRQNFMRMDIGKNKADVVARAASRMITDEVAFVYSAIPEFITTPEELGGVVKRVANDGAIPIIAGAVDNNASRKIVHDFVTTYDKEVVWVDGGNSERRGQVIVMPKNEKGEVLDGFYSPFELHDEFNVIDGDERRPDQISCAEQSESAPQNIAANVLSATTMFMLINKIVAGETVLVNELFFDSIGVNIRNGA